MSVSLAPQIRFVGRDNNGNIIPGGKLFTYAAGTTTKQATYTDSTGGTPNVNPVILDGRGEADVWLSPLLNYKLVLSPSTDTDPPTNSLWTKDNIPGGVNAASVNFTAPGTGAVARSLQSRLAETVSVKDFGAVGDGVTNDLPAILAAMNAVDAMGGGEVQFPAATYACAGQLSVGNGSNSTVSTIHNRITLRGVGYGTGAEVDTTETVGAARILYTGSADATKAVLSMEGPLHSVAVENIQLDANSLAGFGININHVTQGVFRRVSVRNYTAVGWNLITRTGFPTGCAFGNSDNSYYDCYAFNAANNTAHGISLNSGVSTGASLAFEPSSARNRFFGGTFEYGGNSGSYGAYLSGADNNQFHGVFFLPKGGSSGGLDVYLLAWPTVGDFPKENVFFNCGMTRGVGPASGGPTGGNMFAPFQTGDGASPPTMATAQTVTYDGRHFVNGLQVITARQTGTVANATDLASAIALINDLKAKLITHGLIS